MVEQSAFDKLVGTTLGNYRLDKLIDKNDLGPVFLARSSKDSGRFLLRVLAIPTDLTAEARIVYLGHLQQQANQVAGLQNPYILPLVDYGNHQGMPYLVSLDLSAVSLTTVLAQKGPIDVILSSRYLDQVTTALEYAHQEAVLHRNLTTDCILVKPDGNLVVADFGVMRMLELGRPEAQRNLLYGNSASSAPAPEQLLGKPSDTYTDVYALGAVLYRVLTAHRVFRGATREEILQRHLKTPVPSVSRWRSGLPQQIDSIIGRAMAKDPAQRFQHPGALADAYHHVVAPGDKARKPFVIASPSPAQANPVVSRPMQASSRPQRNGQTLVSRRRMLALVGSGAGAAVAIAAVAVFAGHYLVGTTSPSATTGTSNPPAGNSPVQGNQPSPPAAGGHVLAHTSDIPLNSAKTFPIANSQNPGLLIHLPNNQFVAFNSTCTHAGCPVNYNAQNKLLECPCHSAVFDPARNAAVVQGPATTPLAKITISVRPDGTITQP
jgi:eukaryotic-like serine/threonine-protein kinase